MKSFSLAKYHQTNLSKVSLKKVQSLHGKVKRSQGILRMIKNPNISQTL